MKWSAFRAHLAEQYEHLAANTGPHRRGGVYRHPAPAIDELRDTPFEGDEDPLEELFNQS